MVKIVETGQPISDDAIRVFERFSEINLPKSYREFVKTYNGGSPEPDCFDFHGGKDGSVLRYFYGIMNTQSDQDLIYAFRTFRQRIPQDVLPIAEDPFGNLVCLAVKGKNRGKIYFWDHELETEEGEPDYSNMALIADSFDELLEELYAQE